MNTKTRYKIKQEDLKINFLTENDLNKIYEYIYNFTIYGINKNKNENTMLSYISVYMNTLQEEIISNKDALLVSEIIKTYIQVIEKQQDINYYNESYATYELYALFNIFVLMFKKLIIDVNGYLKEQKIIQTDIKGYKNFVAQIDRRIDFSEHKKSINNIIRNNDTLTAKHEMNKILKSYLATKSNLNSNEISIKIDKLSKYYPFLKILNIK